MPWYVVTIVQPEKRQRTVCDCNCDCSLLSKVQPAEASLSLTSGPQHHLLTPLPSSSLHRNDLSCR